MNFLQKIRLPQGLPSQYVEQLARVGAMPPIAALFEEDEKTQLQMLRGVAKQLADLGPRWAPIGAAAATDFNSKLSRVEKILGELASARQSLDAARAVLNAAAVGEANQRLELERELRENSDSRLLELAGHCRDIGEAARVSFTWRPEPYHNWLTGERRTDIWNNIEQVAMARNALQKLGADAQAQQLAPSSAVEVTEWLQSRLSALEPALAPLGLHDVLGLDENGNLTRDASLTMRTLSNRAIRKAGGQPGAPDIDAAPVKAAA